MPVGRHAVPVLVAVGAIRRRMRLRFQMALVGVIVGVGVRVSMPVRVDFIHLIGLVRLHVCDRVRHAHNSRHWDAHERTRQEKAAGESDHPV